MSSDLEAQNIFRVDGLVAVITGGGTGIGFMIAKGLAANGAKKVYILGRRMDALQSAASTHPSITPLQCDVTDKASLQSAVDVVASEMGYVNLLVANSGIRGPAAPYDPSLSVSQLREKLFTDVDMEDFTQTFHANVTGAFFTMLAFLDLLDAGNKKAISENTYGSPAKADKKHLRPDIQSQVIMTASVGSFMRSKFTLPAYGGSKAAIMQMAKQAATMLASYGIRVNTIAPGFFPSEMADPIIKSRNPEEEGPEDENFIPAQKFGSEREMAGTVLYLASPAGSFCNGLMHVVDGGRLAVTMSTY